MAARWIAVDEEALGRLARLVDVAAKGGASAALLSEIRLQEDRFGLSPASRRRLGWEIRDGEPARVVSLAVARDAVDGRRARVTAPSEPA